MVLPRVGCALASPIVDFKCSSPRRTCCPTYLLILSLLLVALWPVVSLGKALSESKSITKLRGGAPKSEQRKMGQKPVEGLDRKSNGRKEISGVRLIRR